MSFSTTRRFLTNQTSLPDCRTSPEFKYRFFSVELDGWLHALRQIRKRFTAELESHPALKPVPLHDPDGGAATHMLFSFADEREARAFAKTANWKSLNAFRRRNRTGPKRIRLARCTRAQSELISYFSKPVRFGGPTTLGNYENHLESSLREKLP